MYLDRKQILKVGLTGLLCAALLALSHNHRTLLISAYLAVGMVCALIAYAVIRRSWRELLCVVGGGAFLAALDYWGGGSQLIFMGACAFVSLATVAVVGGHIIWAEGVDRRLLLCCFVPSIPVITLDWFAGSMHHITEALHPKTFDLLLYSFDCSLWVQISFLMGQVFSKVPALQVLSLVIYNTLPWALALTFAAQLRRTVRGAMMVMIVFVVTAPIGFLFYNLLPACGPVHVFGAAFPWHPPAIAEVARWQVQPILVKGLRNAIPSLHMTWVLLVWWNSKGLERWMRAIAMAFVVFTVMATLGTGEHYFVDLVVAFPFSLMVQALCSYHLPLRTGERRTAFFFGLFVTLTWISLLSYATSLFWMSPLVPWAMIVATVIPSVALWQRLLRAGRPEQPVQLRAAAAAAGSA
jgi:hypothetical protein